MNKILLILIAILTSNFVNAQEDVRPVSDTMIGFALAKTFTSSEIQFLKQHFADLEIMATLDSSGKVVYCDILIKKCELSQINIEILTLNIKKYVVFDTSTIGKYYTRSKKLPIFYFINLSKVKR